MAEHERQERTDRLENTMRSIEMLQQTGILNVERAKGGVRETASIVFLEGQVIEAMAGTHVAQDALDWVCTWGSCRYTFDVRFPAEMVVPPLPPPTIEEPSPVLSSFSTGFFAQMVQKYAFPLSDTGHATGETASVKPVEEIPTAPFPRPQDPSPAVYPLTPLPPTIGLPSATMRSRVPYRLLSGSEAVNYIERFGLSRLHRHVFFLLDGQRTAVDIVRLTGRSFYEIQSLLAELERLGLISTEQAPIGEAMNGM
jgi:Domain of unknown function (DUF4388)